MLKTLYGIKLYVFFITAFQFLLVYLYQIQMYYSATMSNLLSNVIFIQNGIDEIRRNITMHIDKNNNGGSFVDLHSSHTGTSHLVGYKKVQPMIETILLADLLQAVSDEENPTKIIIKMDIEGFECRAILGIQH